MTATPPARTSSIDVRTVVRRAGEVHERIERVAVEEPLELRVVSGGDIRLRTLLMRTPGADAELAAGFVLNAGVVANRAQIRAVHAHDGQATVEVDGDVLPLDRLERLRARSSTPAAGQARMNADVLANLPELMRARQSVFGSLGGLHASALFALDGSLLAMREDVSCRNATDKLTGWIALTGACDTARTAIAAGGRCDGAFVHAVLAAGIPIAASVQVPSSLAIALAREHGLTLAGAVRNGGWSLFAGIERIVAPG